MTAQHAVTAARSSMSRQGMVLALTAYVWQEGRRAVYGQEPVLITATGPELLSHDPILARQGARRRDRCRCPAARGDHPLREGSSTRIATITLNRPDQLNIPTIACPQAVRGPVVQGEHRRRRQGPRRAGRRRSPRNRCRSRRADGEAGRRGRRCRRNSGSRTTTTSLCPAPARTGPARRSLHWYGNTRSGCRTLQDFKKISILEVKGLLLRLALLPGGRRRPRDLVRRRAVRAPRLPLRRLRAAHVAVGDDDGNAQVPGDGFHRPALHGARRCTTATS